MSHPSKFSAINFDEVEEEKVTFKNAAKKPVPMKDVQRKVKFTSNKVFDAITPPDNTVEICGYVDALERARTVGKEKKYTLIKFVINNNNGKRIQCVAWQEQVDRMKNIVEINKILHLNGAVAKRIDNPVYNSGTVPIELSIQQHTQVIEKGFYEDATNPSVEPEASDWDSIGEMEGRLIKLEGYLKLDFNQTKHKTGDALYSIGAITNGVYKLAVRVTHFGTLPNNLTKGCMVSVTGVFVHDGNNPYIKVVNGTGVKKVEGKFMDEEEMMEAAFAPRKKAKTE